MANATSCTTVDTDVAALRGSLVHNWRAVGLAFATLWSNMLIYALPLHSHTVSAVFDFRSISMIVSVVGFALAYLVARRVRALNTNRPLLVACALLSALATGFFLLAPASIPYAASVAAVVVYSVAFAFLLASCAETYAALEPFRALAWAGGSYLVGWLGAAAADQLPDVAAGLVTAAMPLALLATLPCWGKSGAAAPASSVEKPAPEPLGAGLRRVLAVLPPRILVGLFVTHLALGVVLSAASVATSSASFLSAPCVAAAAVMAVACVVVALALKGRVPLVTFYKVAMVVQAIGIFLLYEAASEAQALITAASVGVYVVTWAIVAQCARGGVAAGALPAMVCAVGRLVEQLSEGMGLLITKTDLLSPMMMAGFIGVLLLVAAAFLFTGTIDDGEAGARLAGVTAPQALKAEPAGPTLEERVSALAGKYNLSARETEVFALWATGHDVKYVQDKLGLSQSTVKTHVRHIYAKTDTHSRAEVVILLDESQG